MRDHRCVRGSAAGRQFSAERLRPGLGLASGPAGFRRPQVATCARPARATSCASRTSESSQVPLPRPLILFAVTVTKGHRWDIRVPGHWQTGFPPPRVCCHLVNRTAGWEGARRISRGRLCRLSGPLAWPWVPCVLDLRVSRRLSPPLGQPHLPWALPGAPPLLCRRPLPTWPRSLLLSPPAGGAARQELTGFRVLPPDWVGPVRARPSPSPLCRPRPWPPPAVLPRLVPLLGADF